MMSNLCICYFKGCCLPTTVGSRQSQVGNFLIFDDAKYIICLDVMAGLTDKSCLCVDPYHHASLLNSNNVHMIGCLINLQGSAFTT